jgi:hypothetical protein
MARAKRPSRSAGTDASRVEQIGSADDRLPAAARMLFAGVIALTVLRALAAFVPGRWMWGIDLGRDLPGEIFAAGLAVTGLACVPEAGRWLARVGGSGPERVVPMVCAVALALFAWNSPDRALYIGDASLRHGAFARVSDPQLLAEQALGGDLVLHHTFPRWVADHTPWTEDQGGRALGALVLPALWVRGGVTPAILFVVSGSLYIFGAYWFSRTWPRLRPAVFSYHEVWHVFTVAAAAALSLKTN